jgi:hypothetical protein
MQFKIFTIPVTDDGTAIEEMHRFLRGHKVQEMEQQLISTKIGRGLGFLDSPGMSVENIPYLVKNPVRDDTIPSRRHAIRCRDIICYRHVIPNGILLETDLFFYRHSVPNGTHNPTITYGNTPYKRQIPSPVRDGMSVENIPCPVKNQPIIYSFWLR